jgi:hypothetical protein
MMKSTSRTGGRQKGTPNKVSADLRRMILGALEQRGGQKWLYTQMEANPTAFMTLLGKVLPTVVDATHREARPVEKLTEEELNEIIQSGRKERVLPLVSE